MVDLPVCLRLTTARRETRDPAIILEAVGAGGSVELCVHQALREELWWLEGPPALVDEAAVFLRPCRDFNREAMAAVGIPPPDLLGDAAAPGFVQRLPEDPALALVTSPRSLERSADETVRRINLWEGQDLIDSHRHHSHLAGLYPFCTVDPADPAHVGIVAASLHHWVRMGPGQWSGWCVPWAATINARCGRADAAVAWLHWWREVFVNEGRGTLHDATFPGLSVKDRPLVKPDGRPQEVMQLDAGFGALAAVYELLVQQRGDGLHVLPAGLPRTWRDLSFDGVHAEGGFVLGATVTAGAVAEIRLRATRAGRLRLRCGLPGVATLDRELAAGEALRLGPGRELLAGTA